MTKIYFFSLIIPILLAAACTPMQPRVETGATTLLPVCRNQRDVVESFYTANDEGNLKAALAVLTDDVVLIMWDEGMNGRHLDQKSSIGLEAIGAYLGQDGLRKVSGREDLSELLHFEIQDWRQSGNQVFFRLMPERLRPNGRPYNPYAVEIIFRGCEIELIKITERITWI